MSTIPPDSRDDARGSLTGRECLELLSQFIDMLSDETRGSRAMPPPAEADPPYHAKLAEIMGASDACAEALIGPVRARLEALGAEARELDRAALAAHSRGDPAAFEAAFERRRARAAEIGRECEQLARDLVALVAQSSGPLLEVFPDNPIGVFNTGGHEPEMFRQWFKPDRIYLDVTDARRDQVDELWRVIQWEQDELRRRGLSKKRGPGNAGGPRSPKVKRWVERSNAIGERAALEEFRTDRSAAGGLWFKRYKWWWRNVRPHLRRHPP